MSVKKLFDNNKQIVTVGKFLKLGSPEALGDGIESAEHLQQAVEKRDYFLPPVDYSNPENFVKFGSAEEYYKNAFDYIANYYPYDGSNLERVEFYNKISPLEKYVLEDIYPTSTGFVTLGSNYGTIASNPSGYYSASAEYIQIKGGPHSGSVYNEAKNRTSNLEFGGAFGNTVEFFLKKNDLIDSSTESERQVVFDLWNGSATTAADYGRLRIELVSGSEDRFYVTMKSGSNGFTNVQVPSAGGQTISDGTFRNFSFVFNTSGSSPSIDFFVNGTCVETGIGGAVGDIGLVTGSMIGNIGALRTDVSGLPGAAQGYGKLSGSVDEFRFWKANRNDEQIGRYWFDNVGGGTDSYDANVSLGVYLKFNEGITQTASIDQVCLDYSGRLSNGLFVGYDTVRSRNTGSAINSLNLESVVEVGDPIVRTDNSIYSSTRSRYILSGSNYDYNNNARLLNHFPNWIIETEEQGANELVNVTQIISSYFDTLYNQLTALKSLKHVKYISGSLDSSINEYPYNDRLVESMGLEMPEFFQNAGTLQQFLQRDEQINFDNRLVEVKNSIYKNIYNNLAFILKSKGTEKSIRNFIRCLGVSEEIIALNTYPDNSDFEIKSNYLSTTSTKKFADFTGLLQQADDEATVYQYPESGNANSRGFITGSSDIEEFAFSLQGEVVFPDKDNPQLLPYDMPRVLTSSIMGFHTPADTDQTSTDLTWETAGNDHGLQVFLVRSPGEYAKVYQPDYLVRDGYFLVQDRAGTTLLTSSIFNDVYDNQKWNLTLSLRPKKYPFNDGINGASVASDGYTLELYGVNYDTGIKRNSFLASAPVSYNDGSAIVKSNKRIYAGAHRTNFTGSVVNNTDVRASSIRFWSDYLPTGTLDLQAKETDTYGRLRPSQNAYSFQANNPGVYIPEIQTLALNWDFANITGSDASGRFTVSDFSSGSAAGDYPAEYQGSTFSNFNLRQHTGRGDFFSANFTPVRKAYVYVDKLQVPEYVGGEEMVKALSADENTFGIYTRPETFYFAVERSMYRSISNRMLELFASIEDFNNLIGEPVNKYRLDYKRMEKVREIFFRKVKNDIPDLEKYVDYYKWLDTSMNQVIEEFFPESARHASDVRKVVENHVLERPKIRHKVSILRDRHPGGGGGILGATRGSVCLDAVGWGKNHHPVSGREDENCTWWRTRAERNVSPLEATGGVLVTRNAVLNALSRDVGSNDPANTDHNFNSVVCLSAKILPPYYGGINQDLSKKRRLRDLTFDRFESLEDCSDEFVPNEKRKIAFRATKDGVNYKGNLVTPFTALSSSVTTGYNASLIADGLTGISLTNIHEDSVHPYRHSVPMQGPFTERWVGGIQARHIAPFRTTDRAEEYSLSITSGTGSITTLTVENTPKGQYLRGLASKSPVNIQNIKTVTSGHTDDQGVREVGNYSKYYEVVQGNDRSQTNMDFVFTNENYNHTAPSAFITTPARRSAGLTGSADYPAPRQVASRRINETIIVDRFSAPGSKEDSKQQFRDVNSDQFSPNNALPFRNIVVRLPHNEDLKNHCDFGGYESGSTTIPSVHKVQRNGVKQLRIGETFPALTVVTASIFDNALVTRPVPAADRAQWTSYLSGADNSTVYDEYISLRSRYPENISFASQDPVTEATFDSATEANLSLQSQFKWGNNRDFVPWKQISNSENPYAKFYTKNNTYELLPQIVEGNQAGTGIAERSFADGSRGTFATRARQVTDRKGNVSNYYYSVSLREPPVTSRYKPLVHQIRTPLGTPSKTSNEMTTVSLKYSYGNDLMGFANRELNRLIQGKTKFSCGTIKRPYEILREQFVPEAPRSISGTDLIKVFSYSETIYPKEIYTYLSGSRARLSFANDFWKNDSSVSSYDVSAFADYSDLLNPLNQSTYVRQLPRIEAPFTTSQGYVVQASEQTPYNDLDPAFQLATGPGPASIWPMDSYMYADSVESLSTILTASAPVLLADAATMPCGELMMTHYGTVNDGITNSTYTDGTGSYQTSSVNSAQYVYNVPVTTVADIPVPAVAAQASLTAVETTPSILDAQTIVISTGVFTVTFTFDQTLAPDSALLRVDATNYKIGVLGVSTTNEVINAVYYSVTLCKFNSEIDVTAQDPGAVSDTMTIVADVAGTAINGTAITGTAIASGDVTQVAFAGGVDATTRPGGERPEPRSPGSVYTRPAWTAGIERRYVDGTNKGALATAQYPFYNTYEEFAKDIRLAAKDHTIVPEFRVSEHIAEYEQQGSLFSIISASLEITGANNNNFDGTNPFFYERFSQTDDIEFLEDFMPTNEGDRNYIFNKYPRHFEINSEAVVKLLPYNGFYPVDRTLDLAALFSSSYGPNAVITGDDSANTASWRSVLRPFYSPGIMYNTIKSGVAVDYPIRRSGRNDTQFEVVPVSSSDPLTGCLSGTLTSLTSEGSIPTGGRRNVTAAEWATTDANKFFWADRLPFEAILDPAEALKLGFENPTVLSDINSLLALDASGSISNKSLDDSLYKKAVSNFLANVPKFFLKKKENKYGSNGYLTKFVSQFGSPPKAGGETDDPVRTVTVENRSAYMMEIGLLKTEDFNFYSNPYAFGIPTATGSVAWSSLTPDQLPSGSDWPKHRGEFAPFTPPHYYGPSVARITFIPIGDKTEYNLDEIINNDRGEVFVSFLNESGSYYDVTSGSFVDRDGNDVTTTASPDYGWNRAWQNRMDIDASITIGNEFPIDGGGTYKSFDPNKWVIMPKWECPTLDFPNRDNPIDIYEFSSSVTPGEYTQETQGMWHQYGVMPNNNQGTYLYIKDIPNGDQEEYDYVAIGSAPVSDTEVAYKYVSKIPKFVKDANRTVRSLADLVGFDPDEIIRSGFDPTKAKRIGELAEDNEKSMSEAILALPFYIDKEQKPRLITLQAPADKLGPKIKQFRKQFTKFSLPPSLSSKLLGMVPRGYPNIPDLINPFGGDDYDSILAGESMAETPVVYLMEHKVNLTRQDLADIWQGIMPDLSTKFSTSLAAVDHYMPGDNVEEEVTRFPEVLKQQLNLGSQRSGHPRYDLLDVAKFPDKLGLFPDIKWLVFKVKERGIGDYSQMIVEEVEGDAAFTYDAYRQVLIGQGLSEEQTAQILRDRDEFSKNIYIYKHRLEDPTYNWPYDYCSLIELGKINTKIGFRPELDRENAEAEAVADRLQEEVQQRLPGGVGVGGLPGIDNREGF